MIVTEETHAGAFLASEANGGLSRDLITVAESKDLPLGAVLGQVTATKKYKAIDSSATDGSQIAAGVLYDWALASGGDVKAVGVVREAVVVRAALWFEDGTTSADQDAAVASLRDNNVIAR